jgi:hypothetical protein
MRLLGRYVAASILLGGYLLAAAIADRKAFNIAIHSLRKRDVRKQIRKTIRNA